MPDFNAEAAFVKAVVKPFVKPVVKLFVKAALKTKLYTRNIDPPKVGQNIENKWEMRSQICHKS